MLLASLTVPAAFVLARILVDRTAGLVAGLLLATSFSHIVLNGHVAWSNNSTPLWTTAALAAIVLGSGGANCAAAPRSRTAWLAASGLLWGVALNSHPSALAMLAGAAVWFVLAADRRRLLASRGMLAGLALGAIVLAPMIFHNISHGWQGVREATAPSQTVATDWGPSALLARVPASMGQLGRMAGAGSEPETRTADGLIGAFGAIRPAAALAYAGILLGTLALAAVRGPRILPLVAGVAYVLLVLVNESYLNFYDTRYLAPLLPLAYAAVGAAASRGVRYGPAARLVTIVGISAMVAYSLASTAVFYQVRATAGPTNVAMRAAADRLADRSSTGAHVFVDKDMRSIKLGGGGDPTRAFDQLLTLGRTPHDLTDVDELRWYLLNDRETTFWIVASVDTAAALSSEFELTEWESGDGWVVLGREVDRAGSRNERP
jgi:hypothetical protein